VIVAIFVRRWLNLLKEVMHPVGRRIN
jgi:hypothetical protein